MSIHNILKKMFQAKFLIPDPGDGGTIVVDHWHAYVAVVSAGAETRILAQPTEVGQQCIIALDVYVGLVTLTVTGGYNQALDTDINLQNAGDWVSFESIRVGGSYFWRVAGQEGTNLMLTNMRAAGILAAEGTISTLTTTTLKLARSAVVAAGSTQGEGGDLSNGFNIVSAADNTKCVDLPPLAGQLVAVVSATVGKSLPVFPASGESIDNAAANAAVTLGPATAYSSALFVADNATRWVTFLGDIT